MTHFDRASLDRLLRATPGAPDWDDVMSRSAALQSHRRRRLVMLAAAALVAVVGTASAIGGVRAFILDKGFIGLPPEGATHSAPESGELVVYLDKHHYRAWVYADGRMIWQRDTHGHLGGQVPGGANEVTSGYLEQRLTPEGVELVRSAVGGLVDRSRGLLETVPDDPQPGPFSGLALFVPPDYSGGLVDVPDGDRFVRLHWRSVGGNAKEDAWTLENFEGTIATPDQLAALRWVEALLTDPMSVLPASAWAVREVRAYVASHYAVCIATSPPKDASHLLSLLPARAADVLRDKSRTRFDGEMEGTREPDGPIVVLGRSVTYCSKLTTDEAREVADAVSGLERTQWPLSLVYRVAEGVNWWEETQISFDAYFPHGEFLLHDGGR
jgi:hypothetical protein